MASLRAIIFDLDDTLLVDEAVSHEALRLVAAHAAEVHAIEVERFVHDATIAAQQLWKEGDCYPYCRSIGISAFECLWGNFTGDSVELTALRCWAMLYREKVFLRALLEQRKNLSDAHVQAQELSKQFMEARRANQRLFPGTRAVLEELAKKFKLGLLTNGAPDLQREKIEATKCGDLFSSIVISGEQRVGKPEPAVFHHVLNALGVTPEEAMMVGNSLERDIAGAHAAGIYSVWMRLPGEKISEVIRSDKTITRLEELLRD